MRRMIVGGIYKFAKEKLRKRSTPPFPGSSAYWEQRYQDGGNSGVGSYDKFAEFKAEVINEFVKATEIQSVIEFGCGDGNQLGLANYQRYLGLDVSPTVIARCGEKFCSDASKSFMLMDAYGGEQAELALSLDVIYHLIEDDVFNAYIDKLFNAATRHVIIYSSNFDGDNGRDNHVRHRKFTVGVERHAPSWALMNVVPNRYTYKGNYKKGSFSDFYFYGKDSHR